MSTGLVQASGPKYTRIYSIGAARGDKIVPNADLVEPISNPYYQTESSTRRACQPSQGFLLVIQI